jgi:hypothetical protein
MCGAAEVRHQAVWHGRAAVPPFVARQVCVQRPAQQAWEQIESKFCRNSQATTTLETIQKITNRVCKSYKSFKM